MEAYVLLCGVGVMAGCGCIYALVRALFTLWSRRCSAMDAELSVRAMVRWRLRNGIPLLMQPARALLSVKRVRRFIGKLQAMLTPIEGIASVEVAATLLMGLAIVLGVGTALVFRSPACLLLAPICLIAGLDVLAGSLQTKRRNEAQEAIPAALESMAVCFGSGYTLQQTFSQVAHESDGAIRALFSSAAHALEAGAGVPDVLRDLRSADISEEMSFVVVALDIQHQTGGSIKQVIDAAVDSVKGELALRRSLRVQTAQAELSARIVSAMPIVLLLLFSLISPGFLSPFFGSVAGWVLLALAVTMQVAGIVLVRKALRIEGMR